MARLTAEKWEEVKAVYCVGKRTNREIGAQFGVSHGAVQQKADKCGWVKLEPQIVDNAIESSIKLSKLSKTNHLDSLHVAREIDKHASDKMEADEVGMMIITKAADLVRECVDAGDLQKIAAAHRSVYEGRFKSNPDTQVNIQNNLPSISVTFDG